jgi:hypothetical protein
VTRNVVERLLFLQGNVISVSPEVYTLDTKKVPDTTTIFSVDGDSQDLKVFTTELGKVEVKKPPFVFPLVGVVIVVGRTYLADMAAAQARQSSTPTSAATSDSVSGSGAGTGPVSTDSVVPGASDSTVSS